MEKTHSGRIFQKNGKAPGLRLGPFGIFCVFLISAAAFIAYAYTSNFRYYRPVPEGCADDFGYAHMAKAVTEGRLFEGHTRRPWERELIAYLKQSGHAFQDYYQMIAPAAYHLDDRSGRIINQYPPGTGLLLALLPPEYRFHLFPPLCAALFLLIALTAQCIHEGRPRFIPAGLIIIILFVIVAYPPPLFSLYDVNSLAPTYGFLFAAGYLLRARSMWAFLFLGTASLFRVANVIFFIPFFLIHFLGNRPGAIPLPRRPSARAFLGRLSASAALFLLGGFGVYLGYVWKVTGSPFHPTYPLHDRVFSTWEAFIGNFRYLSFHSPWFTMHLIVLSIILIVSLPSVKWTLISVSLAAFNYLFFMLHRIHVINYPYATIFVLFGFLVFELTRRLGKPAYPKETISRVIVLLLVALAALTVSWIQPPRQSVRAMYHRYVTGYREVFSGYDVVWGASKGCIIEYVIGKPTLSFHRGTLEARDDIILWFHSKGYKQAVWMLYADDNLVDFVQNEIRRLGLSCQLIVHSRPYYGKIIRIL